MVGRATVRGRLALGIGARRTGEEAVGGGDVEAPFYRLGGGAGWPSDGGERAVEVVRHDGGGGGRFGRGSTGAVVGSDEGGAPAVSGVEGGWEAARTHMRGSGGGIGHSAQGGRRPGGLGRPKAEAQWWVAAVAQWEGKGEWAG
jgi:hypothetical protein